MKFKRNVAYHEAGHAVAARAFGMPVVSVEVYARHGTRHSGIAGRTRLGERTTTDRQELIYLWAGPLAEGRYRKRSANDALFAGFDNLNSDLHLMAALLKELPTHLQNTADKLAYEQARQLVGARWSEIRALAERLVSEGVVHGEEIHAQP